jgi:hypothetical protein
MMRRVLRPLIGRPLQLPPELLARHPVLGEASWRVGGLPPRIGGAFVGQRTVAGITLWRTVFLADGCTPSVELLLHELGHVRQFAARWDFPWRYVWESVRRGYHGNRFEREAQAFAEAELRRPRRPPPDPLTDV